jgi:hypothetical protein
MLTLAAGCATAPSLPVRLIVHVDTIAIDKVQQFEQARVRWVAELRKRRLSDRRGLYLKVGDHVFYSVVAFGRWRELDALAGERARQTSQMPKTLSDEYDRLCDETLMFPHGGEIWVERASLGYVPTQRRLSEAVQLVIEDVKPTEDYEAAWKPIAAALAKVKYPIERRTYFSAYGSGRLLSFWLAPSRAMVQAAPTLEQALVTAEGETRAAELLRDWRATVGRTQTLDVEVNPDMTSD